MTTHTTELRLSELIDEARSLLGDLRSTARTLALGAVLGAVASIVLVLVQPTEFTARTQILPYRQGATSVTALGGLAGLAGVRLPSGGLGEVVISSDIYPSVVATFDFRVKIATSPLTFSGGQTAQSLVTYLEGRRDQRLDVRLRRALGLEAAPTDRPDLQVASDTLGVSVLDVSPRLRRTVEALADRIQFFFDKKTGIFTISGTMPDRLAAADLVRVTAELLTQTVSDYEVRKADADLLGLAAQLDEAKQRYAVAERSLAIFADRNRSLSSAVAETEGNRLEREATLAYEILQQMSREYEQTRVRRNQDTPVFTVLQQVVLPFRQSSPRPALSVAIGVLMGIAGGLLAVLYRNRRHRA